ncbi:putative esterase D14L [Sesamum angolense]|uniref:Esterase D14L n=1 Tax=Sesamum angolense TaxID=2727404 RepID=A0AAE1X2N6_9LAMI|nr:putative esterase D14L [Sesamum angolense]
MSQIEQLFSSIESNFEEWASGFASLVVDATHPLSALKFGNCLKRMRPEVALSLAKTVFLSDHRDILDKVVIPCDIIQTRNDIVVPNSVPKYMQSKIKGNARSTLSTQRVTFLSSQHTPNLSRCLLEF